MSIAPGRSDLTPAGERLRQATSVASTVAALCAAAVVILSIMPVLFGDGGWEIAGIIALNVACIACAGAASELNARGLPVWSLVAAAPPILFVAGAAISIWLS